MNDRKFILTSKTFNINALLLVVGGLVALGQTPEFLTFVAILSPRAREVVGGVVAGIALLNMLLRLMTDTGIKTTKG